MANSDKNIRITPNKGTTSFPKIVFTGQANDPITVNVLDDNSLSFSGSAGQLFSLSNNISSGTIFSVNDISGFPSFRINANGTVSANEFSGNFGIGISNPYYKLQVIGTLGVSGGVALTAGLASTSSTSGALIVTGGVGIGGSINASLGGVIGGVTITSGTLYGNLTGTATTATYSNQAGYAITSGSSSTATTATYSHQAGYAITSGSANAWTTPRTLNLSGDLSGSVVWSGSGDTTLTATIVANAVALGTDTTGQYASTIAISGSGITATAANADDGTAYTIYSSATNNNTASTIVFRDGSGNFSAGIITANLTGTASTASYAHQAGYAITSGSSSIATTSTYSHQAGYAITSGSSSIATTATYSHQSGYGITAGSASIATTATYAHQAGYAITSGSSALATTATYSHQSGYAITSGSSNSSSIATTASNINVNTAGNNIYNPVLFTPQGTGAGVAVSSYPSFSFNPTANILNVSGLAVTSSLASTSTSTGALVVTGGVGIGDSLNVATAIAVNSGTNGLLFQRAAGASLGAIYSTNVTPSTSNYSFAIDGTNLNLNSTGSIFFNNSNTVKATLSANSFAISINVASTSTNSGALTVSGGVGIGGSLYTGTATPDSISGVVLSNGFITSGTWAGSTITAYYGGTGIQAGSLVTGSLLAAGSLTTWLSINPGTTGYFLVSNGTSVLPTYQNPALLSVGLATTATYSHQSGYGITAGSSALATTATYAHQAGYAITSGTSALATTATYAHQSGYGITAGSASIATTATYSHQSGYGITAGTSALATTATYSHQAGYAITSGTAALATTSTYSHQAGYAITAGSTGLATTATNINTNNATGNTTHFLHFSPVATGSGVAVSSNATLSYNPSTLIMSTSGLAVTASTSSTSTSSGALSVSGGLGLAGNAFIGGTVNVTNTTAATGVSNAALVVSGGLGVNGDVFVANTPNAKLSVMQQSGDEGGEIFLNKAATNTTITTGVTIDVFQNKLRFFEQGGTARGFYLDITTGGASVGTNIMGGSSSGTVNSGTATYAAYYPASSNAVSENANLQFTGAGVSIGGNISSTSTTSGSLKVFGGVGIGGSLYVGGATNIGTNTFTKNYSGDINLDNGTADTPGVRYYWQNNRNFGNDVYYSGSGSTRWRVVKEMGETGGAELFSIDREGVVYINNPGSGVVSLKHTGSGSATYTFPNTAPATGTSVLQSDTTGVLSWVPMTAGGGSGSVNSSAANLVAYYPSAGTAVTGNTSVSISGTGLSIGFLTNAADVNTGALTIAGGAGIAGTLWANTIGIGGTITYAGTNVLGSFSSSVNSYNQVIIQNKSNGAAASADFVLNNNLSTDSTFYGNFGMNSSGFTGTGSLNLANAVYLTSTSGDLVVGSTTANIIRFVYNSGTTDIMQITGTGVSILSTTNATSTSTGALTVSGGVGIGGSIFLGSQLTQTYSPTTGAGSDHALFLQSVPVNTTVGAVIQIGSATAWDGTTAGFFTGAVSGTYIGINAASGSTAAAIDFQIAGVSKFQVGSGGSTIINNYTEHKAPDINNKALRVLGFSSSTQGDILSFEHPAGGSFTMNGNFAGQPGGRFTIIASGNSQVRGSTFVIQASDTKVVMGVDATSGGGVVYLSNGTNIQLYNSTNAQYAGFKYTGSATTTYTLPASAPGTGTSVLQSDVAGVMSWVPMTAGGGSGTVTTLTAGTGVTFSTGTTITTTGTIRAKRPVSISFCSGYTPAASGADTVVLRIPSSPSDGTTSLNFRPQQFFVRVETASATASTVQLEKYTGTGAFSGTAITSIGISGASTYELSTNVFAAAGTLLTSGDKLRINFTALSASHANFSVYLLLEEV